MKIYRTLTLPRILVCAIFTAFFTGMMIFTAEVDITGELFKTFGTLSVYVAFIFFYASFGDSHYLYFSKESPGYKYFRSIPKAKERFKNLCIKSDIIFLTLGLLLIIPSAFTGFTKSFYIIGFLGYMFCYAISHISFVLTKPGMNTYVLFKAFAGGMLGMMIVMFAMFIGEGSILAKMNMSTGIIITAVSILLSVIGLIAFYCNFEKKWNVE